jgi:mannose-6-phosphate isomerase-like protein (cupin superfamily)
VSAGRDVDALNLDRLLSRFDDHWQPKKIAELNDYDVKLVKLQGEFVWHEHVDTDELFLVLKGTLVIQLRDRDVVLNAGEMFVVPRGVEHCPKAEDEVAAMLIEPRGVVNTGDAVGPLTTSVEDLV